jgi:hypothetical protein
MSQLSQQDRANLDALALRGLNEAANCTGMLLQKGETVLKVEIVGPYARIEIVPPKRNSPLRAEAEAQRRTATEITYMTVCFGCAVLWTVTRAEEELERISYRPERMH